MKKTAILLLMAALSVSVAMADTTNVQVDEATVVPVSTVQETVKENEEPAAENTEAKTEDAETQKPAAEETAPSAEAK